MSKLDNTLNRIAIDSMRLMVLILLILLIYGYYQEGGDFNSGSLYGIFLFPLIPLIVGSFVSIEVVNSTLSNRQKWMATLTPFLFVIGSFWLSEFNTGLLIGTILLIVTYKTAFYFMDKITTRDRMAVDDQQEGIQFIQIKINRKETEIIGEWNFDGKDMHEDDKCKRIKWLASKYLQKIAKDQTGWETLMQDPEDGRYWELTYPQSEMHGGGPQALVLISYDDAKAKYPIN